MTMQSLVSDDPSSVAGVFRALADPGRLAILHHLYSGEHNVRELTEHLGLAQSTVSAHLACLRDCGLVRSTPRGRSSVYELAAPDALAELIAAADRLLDAAGPTRPHEMTVARTARTRGAIHASRTDPAPPGHERTTPPGPIRREVAR